MRDRLAACYTGVVNDVMRDRGLTRFVLPASITPLNPATILCGPAFTIEGRRTHAATAHETLLAWTGLLSEVPAGSVWVSQPNDEEVAHMGELSAETLAARGVLGVLVDGAIRDAGFIDRLELPCWRRFHTPRDVVGHWLPTAIGSPIVIGNVTIATGDWLIGDRDGVIRIPAAAVEEITAAAATAMRTENQVRAAILRGVDPQQAYLDFGKF